MMDMTMVTTIGVLVMINVMVLCLRSGRIFQKNL